MTDARRVRRRRGRGRGRARGTRRAATRCWPATGGCAKARSTSSPRRGATIVFCEVKTRRGDALRAARRGGHRAASRLRLRTLAVRWLGDNAARADVLRFDVASVTPDGRGAWTVDVLEAAF